MVAGRARYVPGTTAKTDDRGVYRLTGLVPGDYLVVVPQAQVSIPTTILSGLVDSLVSGGSSAGGGLALLDLMSSGINPADALGGGIRIGDFMVASSGSVPLAGPDGRLQAFQTSFYPNASAPVQASVVSLASGEERSDINFQLRLIATSRVSGTAMGPDGPVATLGVRLMVPGDGSISESEFDVATAVTKPDGTFAFYGVPPGQFLLRGVKQPRPEIPAELLASNPTLQAMFGGGAKGPTETLFAIANISVAGSDLDGVMLQLTPGFHVSGRLAFESQAGRAQPVAAQLQNVVIMLTAADGRSPGGMFGLGDLANPDRATAQAEFKTKGYAPGKYFLTPTTPVGWQLKSATIGGRDVLDAPLEIKDADVAGLVVTYTDKTAQLSGTVRAAGETDLSETSVLLFPASYRAWIDNGMNPRRVRTARASRSGAYTITNVPAGEYFAIAIDRASEGDMQDPAYIEALSRAGTRVTVAVDPATLDLTKAQVKR